MTTLRATEKLAADLVCRILAETRRYEFCTFVLGFTRPEGYERSGHEASFRRLKILVGRELCKRFAGADVDFHQPELRIEVDEGFNLRVRPAPLFLAGRYRKLSREIPASQWIHHRCKGRGCPSCSYSGSLCGPSVQEILSGPVLRSTGGTRTLFHALGREDTDALMLGHGRPFVLEVQSPLRRRLNLEEIQSEVAASGLAEALLLKRVGLDAVRAVKAAPAEKTYRVWIAAGGPLPLDAAERAALLAGVTIGQLSPARVMHRRGRARLRERRIVESTWLGELAGQHLWEVRVEAGTYVKELVSGDGGRTRPSLTETLGVSCRSEALDVLEIHWAPPWE